MAMEELGSEVHSSVWSVNCPSAVCHSPKYSNYVVDGFFVPSAVSFQYSEFTSSEYTICVSNDITHTLVSHSMPNPEHFLSGMHSVYWISGDLFCQHFPTKWDKLLCRLLATQPFKWRLPVTTFFEIWTRCTLNVPPTTAR